MYALCTFIHINFQSYVTYYFARNQDFDMQVSALLLWSNYFWQLILDFVHKYRTPLQVRLVYSRCVSQSDVTYLQLAINSRYSPLSCFMPYFVFQFQSPMLPFYFQ
uniref:Uncharacterized protein n=1 Tax=Cacopsylla melanoneura TaxID=428564 RepID=A0A8D8WS61_9HEMI